MEYHLAIKRPNIAICSNMDATRDYHTKWTKPERERQDFPSDAVDKNLPANVGDTGLIPGLGRSSHMPCSN